MSDYPIQPSIRNEIARFLAGSDPRCGHDDHKHVAAGFACKFCRREVADYLTVTPMWWPR